MSLVIYSVELGFAKVCSTHQSFPTTLGGKWRSLGKKNDSFWGDADYQETFPGDIISNGSLTSRVVVFVVCF